ncbi:MAG TPA: hypothetical protein VHM72_07470, partial [Solirubrobacteraceae bacterium]|nr:hypothetical protein [Solirubrobacteraceae bacterium]
MNEGRDHDADAADALDAARRGQLDDLWHRTRLTWRYEGRRATAWRIATFPLRATPLRRLLGHERQRDPELSRARRWYRHHASPVTVLIASHGDPRALSRTVRAVRRTTRRHLVRIEVVELAASLAQTLEPSDRARDTVLLDAGLVVSRHWLAALQYAAYAGDRVAIAVPLILASAGRI